MRAVGSKAAQSAQDSKLTAGDEEPLALQEEWQAEDGNPLEDSDFDTERPDRSWTYPAAAFVLAAAWTGAFIWPIHGEILAGASLAQGTAWISQWSIPVLLICTGWLLLMRNSKREAARFSDAAIQLNAETADLEMKLGTINRELSLAREFLGAQTLELESFGRIASERLSTHAQTLQDLVQTNGEQVTAIADVSQTALGNMERLRDDLPVVANSARDVSNQIGSAGNAASEQLDTLIGGFERLNEFGQASERQVQTVTGKIDSALASFEAQVGKLDEISAARFEALKEQSESFQADLDVREVEALAAMRRRANEVKTQIDDILTEFTSEEERSLEILKSRMSAFKLEGEDLGQAMVQSHDEGLKAVSQSKERLLAELADMAGRLYAMDEKAAQSSKDRLDSLYKEATRFDEILAARNAKFEEDMVARQERLDERETEASKQLEARLIELDTALTHKAEEHIAHSAQIAEQGEKIAQSMFEFNSLIESAGTLSERAKAQFAENVADLSKQLGESDEKLAITKQSLGQLTEDSIRLLEIIQSGAQHSREDLPAAIAEAAGQLSKVEERTLLLNSLMEQSTGLGGKLSEYLITSKTQVEDLGETLQQSTSKFTEQNEQHLEQLRGLKDEVDHLGEESASVAAKTQEQLTSAISQLDDAVKTAFASIDKGLKTDLKKSADSISASAVGAIEQSVQSQSEEAITRLQDAADKAAAAGRETTLQLRDQLAKVNELAGNLEQRVTRAREVAEDQVDNDFARRMALITESLNSNAIDISKSLSADVTDTAWSQYLKGDRGIFTRRAVQLIDNSEARELTALYEIDDKFREHVNRFIHDFEAMLRSVLSTRDGNALGVTVLGSDMGKLYVALAQAIDRLRN